MNIRDEMRDLWEMETILFQDVRYWLEMAASDESNVKPRRAAIRAAFAYMEGHIFQLKKSMLLMAHQGGVSISADDLEKITERDASSNSKPKKIRFIDNVRFSLELTRRVARASHVVDFSGAGYQGLKKSIPVRDRLMHPKGKADLSISIQEISYCADGVTWFHAEVECLFSSRQK